MAFWPVPPHLNHNFVHRHRQVRPAGELFFHTIDDVVGHKGLAIVLSDVAVGNVACLAAEITGELPAVVVLDDDRAFSGGFENVGDGLSVKRNQPSDLKLIRPDPRSVEASWFEA